MSVIVYLRAAEPKFPAASRNPGAVRYHIPPYWVDAIGGEPTLEEVMAVVNPPVPAVSASVAAAALAEANGAGLARRQMEDLVSIDLTAALLMFLQKGGSA